jgi:ATP-binding cassette subfamily B protein
MDTGRIVERGSFRELIAADGHFAEMWRLQQEEQVALAEAEAAGQAADAIARTP